jgi:hypothetical protein
LADTKDPITSERLVSATRQFKPEGQPQVVAEIQVACRAAQGTAANPFGLFVTLTTLGPKADGDTLPAAPLTAASVEYRIDNLGGAATEGTEQIESSYNNQLKANFAALVGGSPSVSKKLIAELDRDEQAASISGLVQFAAFATSAATAAEGAGVPPDQSLAVALGKVVDDPSLQPVVRGPVSRALDGFKWGFQTLTLRFGAKPSEAGAGEYVVNVPLQDAEVVKVAETCGWSRSPVTETVTATPVPVAPEIAANNAASAEVATTADQDTIQSASLDRKIAPRPATCDTSMEPDPAWEITAEACAFTPQPQLGAGSFLLEFNRSGDLTLVVKVHGPGRATLYVGADEQFMRSQELRQEGACWIGTPDENDEEGSPYKVCARSRPT